MLLVHWLKTLRNRAFRSFNPRARISQTRRSRLRRAGDRNPANIARAESLEDRTLLASFTVDLAADVVNGVYGPGDLSLREAIFLANTDGGTPNGDNDIINFAAGLSGQTITLNNVSDADAGNSDLDLTDTTGSITIIGLGANRLTISGNNTVRGFEVAAGVTAEISGLTITNGRASSARGSATWEH